MKNKLKEKSGLTLMELIAAMLIFTFFAISLTAILSSSLRTFVYTDNVSELGTLMNNIADEISSTVSISTGEPKVDGGILKCQVNGNEVRYFEKNGVLCTSINTGAEMELYDEKYYKNKILTFSPSVSGTVVTVNIKIIDKNDLTVLIAREISASPVIPIEISIGGTT